MENSLRYLPGGWGGWAAARLAAWHSGQSRGARKQAVDTQVVTALSLELGPEPTTLGTSARQGLCWSLSALTRVHLCLSTVRVGAQSKEGGVKDGQDGRATVGLQVRPGWRRCSPVGDRSQVAPTSRSHTIGSVWLPSLTEPGGRGSVSWDGPGSRASDTQPIPPCSPPSTVTLRPSPALGCRVGKRNTRSRSLRQDSL